MRGLRWSLIAVFSVTTLFPLLWMLSTSLKTQGNLSRLPPQWIPDPVTLEHYDSALTEEMPFFTLLWNSTVVASRRELPGDRSWHPCCLRILPVPHRRRQPGPAGAAAGRADVSRRDAGHPLVHPPAGSRPVWTRAWL